ncbi:MAG: hypothetical protein AB7P03_22815 [Kofleriaceae bacterium]
MRLDFGFFPRRYDHSFGDITVSTLPELDEKVAHIREHEWVRNKSFRVPTPHRVFAMPKTHAFEHSSAQTTEHVEFLLWCFGFFVGMRMSWMEAGFLDSTPIEEGAMSDIVWRGDSSLNKAVTGANAFWNNYQPTKPRIPKILSAAIHAYFLAQREGLLEYERFMFFYVAVDACHAIHRAKAGGGQPRVNHAERIRDLCTAFGTVADSSGRTVPLWAEVPQGAVRGTQPAIANLRNELFHEGLFFDEPLGFAGFGDPRISDHALGDLEALVSRFIVATLELPAHDYIASSLANRTMEGVLLP